MAASNPIDTILTVPKAAVISGVSRMTMWRWVKSNQICCFKTPGGHYRIRKSDLLQYMHSRTISSHELSARPKILVVDDDKGIRKYFQRLFSESVYEIGICSNGFEAGLWVIKNRPALIILDLFMPEIDGFQVCETIKSDPDTSNIKIMAVSGHDSETNILRALNAGADTFLAKPFSKDHIMQQVAFLLSPAAVQGNIAQSVPLCRPSAGGRTSMEAVIGG